MKKLIILWCLFLVTVLKTGAAETNENKILTSGTKAPHFVVVDKTGKEIRLSDFMGKVVVLDYWATWCGPCMASLPHTEKVAKETKEKGVVVLAVCTSDTRANFSKWLREKEKEYPSLVFACDLNDRDTKTYDERVSKKLYGISLIPTQFVIDQNGVIREVIVGYRTGDELLDRALEKLGVISVSK